MINSLTARIFAIFWFTLATVLMLVLLVPKLDSRQLTELSENEITQGLLLEQHIEVELAKEPLTDMLWWRRLRHAIEKWEPSGERLIMVTSEGRIVGLNNGEIQLSRSARNFIGQSDNADTPKKKKYDSIEILGPFSVKDADEYYQLYRVRATNNLQSSFINQIFDRPLLLLVFTMMISAPLLLWLAWSLAKPARKLKQAADSVARGSLKQHPDLEAGAREFRAAGISFNQMVSALERMVSAQQRLISDISHELRTPLTRLQLAAALMRRRYGEGRELERIETEAQRLDHMINDLLILSRNQHKHELPRTTIDTYNLWTNMLENAQFEAEQMGKTLTIVSPPDHHLLSGNQSALESALENIVRNALRYSHQRIEVSFIYDNDGILIHVDDDGPGVPAADRALIFRPFYRTDEARDRASGGSGIGLAIVAAVAEQHRGWVKAEDSALGGLRLALWFPLHLG